jgi:hypothetical protein
MLLHRRATRVRSGKQPRITAKGTQMSPEPAPAQNKTVVYLLGVIVVLLVALVAIFFVTRGSTPSTTAVAPEVTAPETTATAMPGIKPSTGADFDAATGTKVPAGTTPDAYVKLYYQSILDKKWDAAFKMQPAASQVGGSVQDFQSTQTGYGMTAFKVVTSSSQGDTATVEVEQDLGANGTWGALWTFVKYKSDWVVKSRQVQMK